MNVFFIIISPEKIAYSISGLSKLVDRKMRHMYAEGVQKCKMENVLLTVP